MTSKLFISVTPVFQQQNVDVLFVGEILMSVMEVFSSSFLVFIIVQLFSSGSGAADLCGHSGRLIKNVADSADRNTATLRYRGRGTVEFTIVPPKHTYIIALNEYQIIITTTHDYWANFTHPNFTNSLVHNATSSLSMSKNPWLRIWLSFSARKPAFIKLGSGDLMHSNTIMQFSPNYVDYKEDPFISQLTTIRLDSSVNLYKDTQPRVTMDPIILDPSPFLIPPQLRGRQHDQLHDEHFYLPVARLPWAARGLFEQVQNFELSDTEIKAIQYSVTTEGKFLFNVRQQKVLAGHFPGYLRADMQEPRRTAPGQEMVLEIWLPGQSSPIHNHGETSGIIKVLHGKIDSEWFNPIMPNISEWAVRIHGPERLYAGNYTWLTESIYQTHKLTNPDPVNVAISIQAYGYEDDVEEPVEYFFYIPESCNPHIPHSTCYMDFFPESDFTFEDITGTVMREYQQFLQGGAAGVAKFPYFVAFGCIAFLLCLRSEFVTEF
ncbi:uncharacterized protein LOC129602452 [Paramacrobiotus metropolitanus]|uniref:uncharacterized protein LOC129602452 n=1 Tax=Paramacrobiotus metropolitanus TaxID=2943436 RepID=UPI002445BF03|nr:uncharacterized protein LOC129602452 [Paramacrobiotus metropolitanus]